jgi:hypothetical protein
MRKTNNIFIFLNLKKHSKFFKLFLLFILLFFSVFILTYRLDKNPPGFFIDESIYGYEAFSIVKNKGFSSNGEFLPRFFKNPTQQTRGHSSYVYFNIPFITIFGLKEFSVRLSSVVSSLLLLFTLYFFLKKKIDFFAIFLTLFWWPLTAWVFILSRIGLEHIFGTMISFVVFFLLNFIFFENQKNFFNFILLGLFLLFTFYSFQAGKLIGLSYFGLAIILIFLKEKNNKRKISYLSIIGSFFILTLFLSYSYIKDGSFFYRSNELMYYCSDRFIECFIKNIFSHFNWKYYFLNDYRPPDFPVFRHSILGTSLIPKILAPFLIIGIIKLISGLIKKNPESWLILFSYINGIIPASLTIRGFDSWRSVATLPIIFVLIGFGIDYIFKKIKFIAKKREKIIILLIIIIFFWV